MHTRRRRSLKSGRALAVAVGCSVAIAVAGCSSASDDNEPSSTATASGESTTVTPGPVVDVAATDYATAPDYYAWSVETAPDARPSHCAIFPSSSATNGVAVECSVTFPADTAPVSSPPFEGPPNAVRLTGSGPENVITEGVGPATPVALPSNRRIVVADVTCTALPAGGIDCSKGTSGFKYADGALSLQVAAASTTPTPTGTPTAPVEDTPTVAPPMEGPYTEGTTPAAPGTACGAATGDKVVMVVSGSISCTDAIAVIKGYLALPNDGSHGNANIREYNGWQCVSPTARSAQEQGFGSKCTKGDTVVTAPI